MGVGDLFDGTADLSEFSEKQSIHFDDAIHQVMSSQTFFKLNKCSALYYNCFNFWCFQQAKIEIDENGTVAAAAAAFFQPGRTPIRPKQFICNHPFM